MRGVVCINDPFYRSLTTWPCLDEEWSTDQVQENQVVVVPYDDLRNEPQQSADGKDEEEEDQVAGEIQDQVRVQILERPRAPPRPARQQLDILSLLEASFSIMTCDIK